MASLSGGRDVNTWENKVNFLINSRSYEKWKKWRENTFAASRTQDFRFVIND